MPHALARTPTPVPPTTEHEVPPAPSFASPGTAPSQPAAQPGHSFGSVAVNRPAHGQSAPQPVQARLEEEGFAQALQPPGQGKPLPPAVQTKMEHALGHSFSDVRVHEGPQAKSVGALAYTRGTDLHFAPGRYSPATHEGQKILGHELAHVVQQKAGRVAVPKGPGAPVNANPALEAEADALADRALSGSSKGASQPHNQPNAGPSGAVVAPIQRAKGKKAACKAPKKKTLAAKLTAVMSAPKKQVDKKQEIKLAKPNLKKVEKKNKGSLAGKHGGRRYEQKRLSEQYKKEVSGDTHESEHAIGFEPLNRTSNLPRGGGKDFTKEQNRRVLGLEMKAPAYQEAKWFHRLHIGTGSGEKVGLHGWNAQSYRDDQRNALESGDPYAVSNAVQLNQLGYAFIPGFQSSDGTVNKQADDSFSEMVSRLDSVKYAKEPDDIELKVGAKQKAEMELSRMVARGACTGKGGFPSVEEENAVRKKYGLDPIGDKLKQHPQQAETD